jgi:uncharacterized protein
MQVCYPIVMQKPARTPLRALIAIFVVVGNTIAGPDGVSAYTRRDYATALRLLQPLADQGHAYAQVGLGFMYVNGQGVPQNYAEALKWFSKAADQGDAKAQLNLGFMYYKGQGVQNYVQAHMWLNLAATNPASDKPTREKAVSNRNIVASRMTPTQLEQAQTMAEQCFRSNYKDCGPLQNARGEDKVATRSTSTGTGFFVGGTAAAPSSGFGGGPNVRQANVFGVPNSVDPSNYYLPGISSQAVATSDWYHSDGFYWPRAWPLGDGRYFWPMSADHPTPSNAPWVDGQDFRFGFSTDPQVMPQAINQQALTPCGTGNNIVANYLTTNPFCIYHLGMLVVEPNDPAGIYHWYAEGQDLDSTGTGFPLIGAVTSGQPTVTGLSSTALLVGGDAPQSFVTGSCLPARTTLHTVDSDTQVTLSQNANTSGSCMLTFKNPPIIHNTGVARANNINGPWTLYGPAAATHFNGEYSSFGRPVRVGTNNWTFYTTSYYRQGRRIDGNLTVKGDANFGAGTGTDSNIGIAFQRLDPPSFVITNLAVPSGVRALGGARRFGFGAWDMVNIAGQNWICGAEDARNVVISSASPAVVTKAAHGLNIGDPVYFYIVSPRLTATVTMGSTSVTAISDMSALQVGQEINWTGFTAGGDALPIFPQGTIIVSLNARAGSLVASNPATTSSPAGNWFQVWSLPQPIMQSVTYYVQSTPTADTFTISTVPGGGAISTARSPQAGGIMMPAGGMYVTRVAVDAAMNVLTSPAPVRVSNVYSGIYPGPTYLQNVNCMLENGIMTYYATRGFALSLQNFGFISGSPYNSGNHKPYNVGGALWHEMVDIYSEIVDASAAASAAPMGVRVSAANGVATLTWNDALPTQTYRLYRGTSPTVQTTLVGNVTGLTTTDTPYLQTPAIQYYKLVYLNGGVEQGSRVVHTYVSKYGAVTNQHMTRVWDDGADPATVDLGKIDTIVTWLASGAPSGKNHYNSLERGVSGSFGVQQNTSGVVSKAYDLGTTRMPRGNDLWFCANSAGICTAASAATYNPMGIGGTTPALTVPAGSFGVFGGLIDSNGRNGRLNNIRRKWATTVIASYAKSSASGDSVLMAIGEFDGMQLTHQAGTPGTVRFSLSDDATTKNATMTLSGSATTPHVIAGTFGCAGVGANPCPGTTTGRLIAYADGVAGMPDTNLHGNSDLSLFTTLRGQANSGGSGANILNTGSQSSKFIYQTDPTPPQYQMHNNSTQYAIESLWLFEDEWSAADIAAFTTLLNSYISPPLQ